MCSFTLVVGACASCPISGSVYLVLLLDPAALYSSESWLGSLTYILSDPSRFYPMPSQAYYFNLFLPDSCPYKFNTRRSTCQYPLINYIFPPPYRAVLPSIVKPDHDNCGFLAKDKDSVVVT